MAIMTRPSGAFPTALAYITVGTLACIWMIVSLIYYPPQTQFGNFLLVGFLATGLAVLVIGVLVGTIGRAARHAELPPSEVTPSVEQAEQNAAAHPQVVVPEATTVPVKPAVQTNGAIAGAPNPPQVTPVPPAPARR